MKNKSIRNYSKINIAKWCPYCDQGWILIVKGMTDGLLYCRCNETFLLWKSPQDLEAENFVSSEEITDQDFECASREEITAIGWDAPRNRVIPCKYCCDFTHQKHNSTKRKFGWVVIKKNLENNTLFAKCEICGRIWLDIENALSMKDADEIHIHSYTDPSDDEINEAGWDKYDSVFYIDN